MVLEKTLEGPLDCKEIQPAMLKEISPECSLEGLMLKVTLQYFGHLMRRTDSLEKTLMLGKIEGRRRRGQQRMRWLDGITNSMEMWQTLFSWAPKSMQTVTAAMKLKITYSLEENLWQPRQHIKKEETSLPTKIWLVKAMLFPVVMYGCESRTIKKAEHRRTHAFELWCWRRLLRVPWAARRSSP